MPYVFNIGEAAMKSLAELKEAVELARATYIEQRGEKNPQRIAQFGIIITALNECLKPESTNKIRSKKQRFEIAAGAIFHVKMAITRDYQPSVRRLATEALTSKHNSKLYQMLDGIAVLNIDDSGNELTTEAIQETLETFYKYYSNQCFGKETNPFSKIEGINLEQFERRVCRWATKCYPDDKFEADTKRPYDESALIKEILPKPPAVEAEAKVEAKPKSTGWFSFLSSSKAKPASDVVAKEQHEQEQHEPQENGATMI